jgi:hypothetical protein
MNATELRNCCAIPRPTEFFPQSVRRSIKRIRLKVNELNPVKGKRIVA